MNHTNLRIKTTHQQSPTARVMHVKNVASSGPSREPASESELLNADKMATQYDDDDSYALKELLRFLHSGVCMYMFVVCI